MQPYSNASTAASINATQRKLMFGVAIATLLAFAIVIANRPSFGVGQEIEIGGSHSIPTILLAREGTVVSRMVTGSPANLLDQISYGTPEELDRRLRLLRDAGRYIGPDPFVRHELPV